MGDAFSASHLSPSVPDVPDELDLFDESLVFVHIQDHRSTLPMLGQDQRTLRLPDLVDEPCAVRSKGGEGLHTRSQPR